MTFREFDRFLPFYVQKITLITRNRITTGSREDLLKTYGGYPVKEIGSMWDNEAEIILDEEA